MHTNYAPLKINNGLLEILTFDHKNNYHKNKISDHLNMNKSYLTQQKNPTLIT